MTIFLENVTTLIIDREFSHPEAHAGGIAEALHLKTPRYAASVEEASACLSSEEIALVITDYRISGTPVSGLRESFPHVPFIILFDTQEEMDACRRSVATLFCVFKDSQKNYIQLLPEAVRMLFAVNENEKRLRVLVKELSETSRQVESLKKALQLSEEEKQDLGRTNAEINQAIEKAQSLAMEAELENMAKSDFLVRMSQKIRIPMNSIIGYADLLVETSCGHSFSSFANRIKSGAERLLSELNSVVDFCKIEAGQVTIKEIAFDLELLVYDLTSRTVDLVEDKNIDVSCCIAPELPALLVGDPQRIRQVVMNLLENAAVFTTEGTIELCLDVAETTADRVRINFGVRDTGIGIKKKKLPKIFEAFKSTDDATTKKFGGLGIGLSICQKIVLLLGGEINVESKFKEGTVFNFHTWFKKHDKQERLKCRDISLEGRRVLILENNKHTLQVLEQMAVSFGMAVTASTGGAEALALIEAASNEKKPFDICVVDLELQDKEPFELAAGIKKLNLFHPFLLALSNSVTDVAAACNKAGFNGFLPKPTNRKTFYNMLKSLAWNRRENRKNDFMTQYSIKENLKHAVSILAVCSDPQQAGLLKVMLDSSGYSNKILEDVSAALALLREKPDGFDIVFLNDFPPGYDALLQQMESLNIPAVMIADQHTLESHRAVLGKNCFIVKPVTRPLIYEKIKALVLEKSNSSARS